MLIRQTARGAMMFNIDMTNSELIRSELYFLLPGDVIYVEPLRTKAVRLSVPAAQLILSGISTILLMYTIFFLK